MFHLKSPIYVQCTLGTMLQLAGEPVYKGNQTGLAGSGVRRENALS